MRKNHYRILQKHFYIISNYKIISLRYADIMKIKNWRNQQISILRQKEYITNADQKKYYQNVIKTSFKKKHPDQILVSLLFKGKCIGYGGLVHINWQKRGAEVSALTDPKRHKNKMQYKKDMLSLIYLLKKVAFEELNFIRLYTETFDIRPFTISILEESGFKKEGKLVNHNIIEGKMLNSIFHGMTNDQSSIGNVLVCSISKKIFLMQAVKEAVKRIDSRIKIFGGDTNPRCLAKKYCDVFWKMKKKLELKSIIAYCKKNNINSIIPTRDGELIFWSKSIKKLKENNINVMISNTNSVSTCLDKIKFSEYCDKKNFPVIPTYEGVKLD